MDRYKQAYFLLFNGIKDVTDLLQYMDHPESEKLLIKLRQLQYEAEEIIIAED